VAYHLLSPEVPGRLTSDTVRDQSVWPPRISDVHYEVQDWLGDDLLTSFPVFLISPRAGAALEAAGLPGFVLADADITIEDDMQDIVDPIVRTFRWLRVTGAAGDTDVGFDERAHLVVSDRALDVLQDFQLDHCDIEDWPPPERA
jgi:hypothetical protein